MMKPENIRQKLGEFVEKAGKTGRTAFVWFQSHGKIAAAGAVAVVILAIAMMPGGGAENRGGNGAEKGIGRGADEGTAGRTADLSASPAQALDGQPEPGQDGVLQQRGTVSGPVLEEDQIKLLDGLTEVLKSRDLEAAGTMLLDNEQKLDYLFYQVMKGERYLYRAGELSADLEGEGLVMTRPMAASYGTFQNGAPEGAGVAVQGIELDGLRYDYADGVWKAGKLNGKATAGYHYYEGVGDGESREVKKNGTFVEDRIDGAFTYETLSVDGEVTVWDMEAEDGKTKLGGNWLHDDEKQYYYLPSREISNHTYVIPDSEVEEVRWRNLLPWEE